MLIFLKFEILFDQVSLGPMPTECSSITDEELVTYNVKELNRVLKTKGMHHYR